MGAVNEKSSHENSQCNCEADREATAGKRSRSRAGTAPAHIAARAKHERRRLELRRKFEMGEAVLAYAKTHPRFRDELREAGLLKRGR